MQVRRTALEALRDGVWGSTEITPYSTLQKHHFSSHSAQIKSKLQSIEKMCFTILWVYKNAKTWLLHYNITALFSSKLHSDVAPLTSLISMETLE